MGKEDSNVCEEGETKKKLSTENIRVIPLHTCNFYAWLTTLRWIENDRKTKGESEKERRIELNRSEGGTGKYSTSNT